MPQVSTNQIIRSFFLEQGLMIDASRWAGNAQTSMEKTEVVVPSDLPTVCLIMLVGLRDNLDLCYLFFRTTKTLRKFWSLPLMWVLESVMTLKSVSHKQNIQENLPHCWQASKGERCSEENSSSLLSLLLADHYPLTYFVSSFSTRNQITGIHYGISYVSHLSHC